MWEKWRTIILVNKMFEIDKVKAIEKAIEVNFGIVNYAAT